MENLASFGYIVPELILAGAAIFLLLLSAGAQSQARWKGLLFPALAGLSLVVAFVFLLANCSCEANQGVDLMKKEGGALFFGLLATDHFSLFFRALVIVATFVCVIISIGSPSLKAERKGEYHGLLLILTLGMCLLASSNHLMMIYVSMEAVSLCSYLLVGWNSTSARSREAGVKYVLYGGVASGVMLFGMSLFYGMFGGLSLQQLHSAIASSSVLGSDMGRWAGLISFVFMMGGFGYKIAAVPFHMWSPDAYEGAPTPFTALLSVGPKAAGFAVLMRFCYGIFAEQGSLDSVIGASKGIPWLLIIGILSALTMTLGNLTAIVQNNLKRLLAYSSIAHAGYLLMGVTAGGQDGFEAVSIYLGIYLIMNMGAFAVISSVERATGSEDIGAYRGLGKRAPVLGIVMAIFLISLTGLPPTAGFIGKLYLFVALIHKGGFWFEALAVVGVINSAISLYYYARVLKAMYLDKADDLTDTLSVANPATLVAVVLAIPTLLFGIYWQPLAELAEWSANMFH